MRTDQIACQLYTLRDHCKTATDLAATLGKVRAIGYRAIQVSGVGPITEEEIIRIATDHGLAICATHESGETIRKDPRRVVERLQKLGCRHTAYPYPAGVDFADPASVAALARDLDASGEVLANAGCTLSYHNHAIEFVRMGEGTVLEYIYARTRPAFLLAELDTYWVQAGGGDPVTWIEHLAGRQVLLHLKDYAMGSDNKPHFSEVGSGNLDMPAIVDAGDDAGVEWFIVEQDTCPGDPFESIRKSFEYLRDNLAER